MNGPARLIAAELGKEVAPETMLTQDLAGVRTEFMPQPKAHEDGCVIQLET